MSSKIHLFFISLITIFIGIIFYFLAINVFGISSFYANLTLPIFIYIYFAVFLKLLYFNPIPIVLLFLHITSFGYLIYLSTNGITDPFAYAIAWILFLQWSTIVGLILTNLCWLFQIFTKKNNL